MAYLGREKGGLWFETSVTDARQKKMVFKSLVVGLGRRSPRVLRSIVQAPGQAPLLLPASTALSDGGSLPSTSAPSGRFVARERIRTAAGVFLTKHYRRRISGGQSEDAWFSRRVKGWPLIRFRGPRVAVELIAFGQNAKSEIVGRPRSLPGLRGPTPSKSKPSSRTLKRAR